MRFVIIVLSAMLLTGLTVWRFGNRSQANAAAGGPPGAGGAARASRPAGGAPGGAGGGRGGPPTVGVAVAGPGEIESSIDTVGSLESPNKALIAPKFTGRIESISVREGDAVTVGQVLVKIDPSELDGEVAQRQSSVAEARARLAQAQLGQNPAAVSISSAIELQKSAVAVANSDFLQVQANQAAVLASADQTVNQADARLRGAEADVQSALAQQGRDQANLENSTSKLKRAESLFADGFVSLQSVENSRTELAVAMATIRVSESNVNARRQDVISGRAQLESAKQQLSIAKRKSQADLTSAKAKLAQAKASLNSANANQSQTSAYKENLSALRASVQSAEGQLRQSMARRQESELRSPITGIVTLRNADPGSLASPGNAVLVVQSTDWLFVRSAIPVEQGASVRVGLVAKLTLDSVPGEAFEGKISNLTQAADNQSRQLGLLIRLENTAGKLNPGMFGHVSIVTKSVRARVTVPREAIRAGKEGQTVAVVDKDLKVSLRPVKIGGQSPKLAEITDGVKSGDQVVILAYDQLREGQTVKLVGAGRSKK